MCVQPQLPQPPHLAHHPPHGNRQAGGKGGGHTWTYILRSSNPSTHIPPILMTKVTATLGEQLKYLALTRSVAVTEDAVQAISTCKRLEVLDLQGTRVEVNEREYCKCDIEQPAVFPGCRACLTVGSLDTTAPLDLLPLPTLAPTFAPTPPYPCHPDLPTFPP